jgi:hypothetical protein
MLLNSYFRLCGEGKCIVTYPPRMEEARRQEILGRRITVTKNARELRLDEGANQSP